MHFLELPCFNLSLCSAAFATAGRVWRGHGQMGSSGTGTSSAAPAAPVAEDIPPAAPVAPVAEEELLVAVVEEEADDASSDDSKDSYTARDGRHYHWKFVEMEKQYF